MSTAPRLFVTDPLAPGADLSLGPDHARYLSVIMRRGVGDSVRLFNGADGEWRAVIVEEGKKTLRVRCEEKTREQIAAPDLHLLFSPVKKARTDFIVEKATELGVRTLRPVLTERSNAERVRTDRFEAIAREASEQTERLDLPQVWQPEKLAHVLREWEADRPLIYCDEAGDDETAAWGGAKGRAPAALETLRNRLAGAEQVAVLIGPEGGFSPAERDRLRSHENVIPVSLGPRILRADTASVAALTLVQAVWGDWR